MNEVWVADDLGNKIVIQDEKLRQIETIIDNDIEFPMDIKFTYAQAFILSRNEGKVSVHMFDQNTKEYTNMIIHSNNIDPIDCHIFQIHTKVRDMPLCLAVLQDDIYILYKP